MARADTADPPEIPDRALAALVVRTTHSASPDPDDGSPPISPAIRTRERDER